MEISLPSEALWAKFLPTCLRRARTASSACFVFIVARASSASLEPVNQKKRGIYEKKTAPHHPNSRNGPHSLSSYAGSYRDRPTGLSFPDELGGMTRGSDRFREGSSGLGSRNLVSKLRSRHLRGFLHLQSGDQVDPDGSNTKEIHDQWKQAEDDIYTLEKQGKYLSVKKLYEASALLWDGSKCSHGPSRRLFLHLERNQKLSYLYLWDTKNFIKIRFTFPET